jgi:hypothetical protein
MNGLIFAGYIEMVNKIHHKKRMETSLYQFEAGSWKKHAASNLEAGENADLVLCLGAKQNLSEPTLYQNLRKKFPVAQIALCSTAGEIYGDLVLDDSLVAVAIRFGEATIKAASVNIKNFINTYEAACNLAKKLPLAGLKYVLVLSDGSLVNGSELVKGLGFTLGKDVLITGGLAGNALEFNATLTGLNASPVEGEIVAIGFYGDAIQVTCGSQGGWDVFGLEKRVTGASGNVLMELEQQNALDLYKKYLGPEAEKLPGSALLFPLSVVVPGEKLPVVRTILSVNPETKTMTFAGDIPEGSKVRFMKANERGLTAASAMAAANSSIPGRTPGFSLLISCVGRKQVLGGNTREEVLQVDEVFQHKTLLAGFYSYGELSPFNEGGRCQLHNQTMTITTFYEN